MFEWPDDHDRPHEHINEEECWCGPQRFTVAEGTIHIHYGADGEYAPAAVVIEALQELIADGKGD